MYSRLSAVALGVLVALCAGAHAATSNFSSFTALDASVVADSLPETAPFQFGNASWQQLSIANRGAQLAAGQSNSGTWDMIDANRTGIDAGRYLFTVFETDDPGVQRTDRWTGVTVTLWSSSGAGVSAYAFDGVRWTPFGTLITAEEDWGAPKTPPEPYGRVFELTNPTTAAPGGGQLVHRNSVARVAHEGLAFDKNNNLYYVDEFDGGSIYRYTSATPATGSTFFSGGVNAVLRVGDGNTDNATGASSWVGFTNATGVGLDGSVSMTYPGGLTSVDGRATTDLAEFKGTNYQRPEDLEIQTLSDGTEILYFTATTTHEVYSVNLATNQVARFVNRDTIDAATGLAVGIEFTNPDNLAIDADGNIYIVEDQPGGYADIWFATDANRDGVAESISRWATMSTVGAEPSGLYFDVLDPNVAFVNVQHPSSGIDRMIQVTAVPEPETYAMMLVGVGLIGWQLRRRVRRIARRRLSR